MEDIIANMEKEVSEWTAEEPVGVASYSPHVIEQVRTLPQGVPQSFSEAIADIDEGEREFERGETYTHREVMQMLWDKIDSYAS